MRRISLILLLSLTLIFSGCSKETNYIAPVKLTQKEEELLKFTSPELFVLCEFDADDYKSLSLIIEEFKGGELVSSEVKGKISDASLGNGKIYIEYDDERNNYDMVIGCRSKCVYKYSLDINDNYSTTIWDILKESVLLEDNNEIIIFFRGYNNKNQVEVSKINDINEYEYCFRIKALFEK
jgi:hypothetical protein